MNHFPLLLFCCFILVCTSLGAQTPQHRPGEFLVSLAQSESIHDLANRFDPASTYTKISSLLNIWLLHSNLPEQDALEWLRRQPEVRIAQFNHILQNRSAPLNLLPDDPLFPQQWHYLNDGSNGGVFDADLDAEQAWDISTGGLSPAGDTIVIAVIDGGIDAGHPDLQPNLWHNWHEIPNNGFDDDANGYKDDFRGWNVFSESDAIEGNTSVHGTSVSAILGAKGNNGIGVTGVNWNTKIMFVAASGSESSVLAAYDYVWQARERYNTNTGTKGAFVVAVNCSWGIDYGQPSDAPLWCQAFDELGAAGIISVAATANLPINVDELGDLPTACPSNFLIGVTSLDRSDEKAENAAWGPQHVDLGAYGQEVYTAAAGGGYGHFNGTSFAAPQVTGAVGLLYSSPCPNLIALSKTNPASAAYWVKSLILENATPNPSLDGKTVSGGRLNLFKTLNNYQDQCSSCPAPFALKTEALSDTAVLLLWSESPSAISVNLRWRVLGMGIWKFVEAVADTFLLPDLDACIAYEFEMQSICALGAASAWSQPFIFETEGCCTAPASIWLESSTANFAKIAWEPSSFNNTYRLRIRESMNAGWEVFESEHSYWEFQGLSPCTDYQLQVQAKCEEFYTDYSPLFPFATKGCGACNEVEYCDVTGANATEEWIASVKIGAWVFYSGPGGNGYQNFADNQTLTPQLPSQGEVTVIVTPGFSGGISKEYFRIFVDFNQDGDFEDDAELAFDPGFALEGPAAGVIQVPALAAGGITRLRVMMKYTTPNDTPPSACSNFDFGQVEDYCAELWFDTISTSIHVEDTLWVLRAYPQPAGDWAMLEYPEQASKSECNLLITDLVGRTITHQHKTMLRCGKVFLDTSKWAPGIYAVQARCGGRVMRGKLIKA